MGVLITKELSRIAKRQQNTSWEYVTIVILETK